MKNIALLILLVGLLVTFFAGFNFITREKVVDLGSIEITQQHSHYFGWSPLVGVVMIVVGGAIYLSTSKVFSIKKV